MGKGRLEEFYPSGDSPVWLTLSRTLQHDLPLGQLLGKMFAERRPVDSEHNKLGGGVLQDRILTPITHVQGAVLSSIPV